MWKGWKQGESAEAELGTCVYNHGIIKPLFRYLLVPSGSHNGQKLVAYVYNSKYIALVNLKNNQMQKFYLPNISINGFCWFPDDKKILYVGCEKVDNLLYISNLCTFDFETKKTEKITSYTTPCRIPSFALSPDGKRIVYGLITSDMPSSDMLVNIIDIDAKKEEVIPFHGFDFAWSPDGKTIAMYGRYSGNDRVENGGRIILYDVATKTYKRLDKPGGDNAYMRESNLSYSPDGKYIAFVRNENDSKRTLWMMDSDGTHRRLLIGNRRFILHVNWSR